MIERSDGSCGHSCCCSSEHSTSSQMVCLFLVIKYSIVFPVPAQSFVARYDAHQVCAGRFFWWCKMQKRVQHEDTPMPSDAEVSVEEVR